MLNKKLQKKRDYVKRQSKLELSNLKRTPNNFKMRLCSITQPQKVKNHLN